MTDFQKTEQGQEPAFSNTEPKPLEASAAVAPKQGTARADSAAASQAPGWERATLEKLMFQTLEERFRAGADRKLIRLPLHINDDAFADALVAAWREIARPAASARRA